MTKEQHDQKVLEILVALYTEDRAYVAVARLCDEVLDKSGGLLGRVRDAAIIHKGS